jgi:hypothetical protein
MKDSEKIQLNEPYESTKSFYNELKKNKLLNKNTRSIIDIGTGIGSNMHYFSKKNKHIKFLGIDYQTNRIEIGNKINKNPNITFKKFNILRSVKKFTKDFDGLISIHTLCCFKKIDIVIKNFCLIKPKWIAINSLFFDGPLDVLIHIRDHKNPNVKDNNPNSDFNIFSLIYLEKLFNKFGYKIIVKKPFFPKDKIKKPPKNTRGSYTIKTEINKNTTFSGPVYLPWYFIIAKKK